MKSQIKVGAILGYINMFCSMVITLVYTPFLIKCLGQSEHGLYSLVASVISYLSVLDMGFGNAMVRYISKSIAKKEDHSEINGVFLKFYYYIGIISFLIGLAILYNIPYIFRALTIEEMEKARIIMLVLITSVSLSFPLSVFDSYAVACEKFKMMKMLKLLKTIMIPLTMLPLLLYGYKAIAMVIISATYNILFHVIALVYCFKVLNMKISFERKKLDKSFVFEMMSYSFYIFLNIIVDHVYNNTDQILLGAFSGTVAVSIYAVANKITTMNTQFSTNISGVFFPRINKLLEEDDGDKKVSDIFIKVSRIQLYVLTLLLSGFIVFGKGFIKLWVGNDYIDAYYIILLLISPAIIPLTQNIGISIIQAKNKHKFRSIIYILIAVLNILVSIPLTIQYAGIGAAIGTLIANLLGPILCMNIYYWKKANINIPRYWFRFLTFTVPIIIVSILLEKIIGNYSYTWISLIIYAAVFAGFYAIYSLLQTNIEEKEMLKSIINKIFKRRIKKSV